MRRGRQEPEPYLPSSTRAIAWGAMFFAFLSFLMSSATLLMTYRGGELMRNLKSSSQAIQDKVKQFEKERRGSKGNKLSQEASRQWDELREKMERVEEMVRGGDGRAKYYLENISSDLENMRKLSSSQTAAWLGQLLNSMQSVRDQISNNAPEAARRLQSMAADLKKKVPAMSDASETQKPAADEPRRQDVPPSEKVSPESTGTPESDRP